MLGRLLVKSFLVCLIQNPNRSPTLFRRNQLIDKLASHGTLLLNLGSNYYHIAPKLVSLSDKDADCYPKFYRKTAIFPPLPWSCLMMVCLPNSSLF